MTKTPELQRGIDALRHQEFRPSLMTFTSFAGGHLQTLMSEFKEVVASAFYGELSYDKQEVFTFKDGGQIYLNYKGQSFLDEAATNESNA